MFVQAAESCPPSDLLAPILAMVDAGFSRVYDLSGSIVAWQADGGEVVTGD